MNAAVPHWHIDADGRGKFRVIANVCNRQRRVMFIRRADADAFVAAMTAKSADEQVRWIDGADRRAIPTAGRMDAEWARDHRQVLVRGGFRGQYAKWAAR